MAEVGVLMLRPTKGPDGGLCWVSQIHNVAGMMIPETETRGDTATVAAAVTEVMLAYEESVVDTNEHGPPFFHTGK